MIYLDNAATTFPKPACVMGSVTDCMANWCGNPGRGSHMLANRASRAIFECREAAADFFGLDCSDGVVLCQNATHALNIAIFGLLSRGDHVLISDLEHNSVYRPVKHLENLGVKNDVFKTDGDIIDNIKKLITPSTRAIICIHSSNIVNRVLPIKKIGEVCRDRGILFIVDASQSAGVHEIDMKRDCISVLCTAGHKGLLGPQGTGIALFADGILPKPLLYGGSGINSLETGMPDVLPDRLEAGTQATPAITGLCQGIKYVKTRGIDEIREHEKHLAGILHKRFMCDPRFCVYSKPEGGIFLFNVKNVDASQVGEMLDRRKICCRTGLHCAPLAHKTVGTPKGGAVRISVGPFNTEKEILKVCGILSEIASR